MSFVTDAPVANFARAIATVSIESSTAPLPPWWNMFNSGACRQTSLNSTVDFTGVPLVQCGDPWGGIGVAGITSFHTQANDPTVPANEAVVTVSGALASDVALGGGIDYCGFSFLINHAKTFGTGACAGCTTRMTLSVDSFTYGSSQVLDHVETSAVYNGCITWQSASPCGAVPVLNFTWRRVQSLYR